MINKISFEELSKIKEKLDKEKINNLDWVINTTSRLFPYTLKTGEKVIGVALCKFDYRLPLEDWSKYMKLVLLIDNEKEKEF